MPRTPDACRHRIRLSADRPQFACGLVGGFLSSSDFPDAPAGPAASAGTAASAAALPVVMEVCEACCKTFEPTAEDLNPVVASVLFTACEEAVDRCDDADECRRLHALQSFAEARIPILLPDEDNRPPECREGERIDLDQLERLIPPRRIGADPSREDASRPAKDAAPLEWCVGVTTAPRRQPTLARSLRSLAAAGWPQPHLFVDGDPPLPDEVVGDIDDQRLTQRRPAVGAWPNYLLSLAEMLHRQPTADAYLLVQDDALFPDAPVREYLDRMLGPQPGDAAAFADRIAAVSLYTAAEVQRTESGWTPAANRWELGAVAVVYSRAAVASFLGSPRILARGLSASDSRTAGIDTEIGWWLEGCGERMWHATPSVVEHIGETSTIWPTARALGNRIAGRSLVSQPQR